MFECNDSSSSSDEELFAVFVERQKQKKEHFLEETIFKYTGLQFLENFRVSREVAEFIAKRFEESEYFFKQSGEFGKLSGYFYTVVFLWFAGHEAASYRDVADRFRIAISTLRKIVQRMTYFLSNLAPEIITWPTSDERRRIRSQFSLNGFPGVVGVIDGSHVRIDKPSEDPDCYLNRNGFYSLQFQIVCDHRGKIRDVIIGFPGSVHDSRVFRASPLSENLIAKCGGNYILGDSDYPCLKNLLTPYKDLGNLTRAQQRYNAKLSETRSIIEHCFGILKQKFTQLNHLKLRGDHDLANFIRACCVLHNLALEDNFPTLENIELQQSRESIRQEHSYDIQVEELEDDRDGAEMRNHIANLLFSG
ncbi:putative nuclease HARBI1 isoform X1 [Dendroctonus ponderosae]|uniref:putative nuclease HARBI1 isoform X1 n=1 Tax=Dendroctonus ponderosae TaxID=77166 RepID=UPI002035CEF6|nr:putative nuclease HARBI1 isoform X1 [Dendroctonus ponderosae]XP_048522643.1 putative nuclease HARBI1 isoform X1 [Dendroctonus ponderosae]XP_048522644.1 putative nuclease HARBI1 isoform X1 [Dendroctonus ponderosae]